MTKKVINSVLNFFFPQQCVGCGAKEGSQTGGLCDKCLSKIGFCDSPCSYIFTASAYCDDTVKKAIWFLKYRGIKQLAEPLAELICSRIVKAPKPPFGGFAAKHNWIIVPIPISKKRLRQRGFNQAELIAKHLSAKMSVKTETNVLYKKFHTESQVSVKERSERLKNLKGSFGVKNPELISGKNIILVDDVTTTGATISEAREVLRKAGAGKIVALVVASG